MFLGGYIFLRVVYMPDFELMVEVDEKGIKIF